MSPLHAKCHDGRLPAGPGQTDQAWGTITGRCLIAADVDRTVLSQDDGESAEFCRRIGPELVRAAHLGAHLALLTGNSMDQLSSRALRLLVRELAHTGSLADLARFHFFCNSGGVYAHFPAEELELAGLVGGAAREERVLDLLTVSSGHERAIHPRFIDADYLERCRIPAAELPRITRVLEEAGDEYVSDLHRKRRSYSRTYDLEAFASDFRGESTRVEPRLVRYGRSEPPGVATVQVTLKPVLSFRYAHQPSSLFGEDLRVRLTERIQSRLDQLGLGHYLARPGGRASIDVTLEKLDKAFAMEFLIDRLNLQGSPRLGERTGSNATYFGDEVVVGGGNDYPVTRIPGLLVFAVNRDKSLVPFKSTVMVPAALFAGPEATAQVLSDFNRIACRLQRNYKAGQTTPTALQALKAEMFAERVRMKIPGAADANHFTPDEWQALHAFVTLLARPNSAGKQWLATLIDQLDAIMLQLSNGGGMAHQALGASHPDA